MFCPSCRTDAPTRSIRGEIYPPSLLALMKQAIRRGHLDLSPWPHPQMGVLSNHDNLDRMSRLLDKFTYATTYKQEFCTSAGQLSREVVCDGGNNECKAEFVPGIAVGSPPAMDPEKQCLCQSGGYMNARGAEASGQPTHLNEKCVCFTCGKCSRSRPAGTKPLKSLKDFSRLAVTPGKKFPRLETNRPNVEKKLRERVAIGPKTFGAVCSKFEGLRPLPRGKFGGQRAPQRNPEENRGNIPWLRERRDERRDPDFLRLPRNPPRGQARETIHYDPTASGPQRNVMPRHQPTRRLSATSRSDTRIPGPFWIRQRPDERREINALRRRKFEMYSEAKDVIHGEGTSGVRRDDVRRRSLDFGCRRRPAPNASATRVPGPFWLRQRPDERREIDALRRRKFNVTSEARDVIHGEGTSAGPSRRHPFDPPRICRPRSGSHIPGPFWMRNRPDERQNPEVGKKKKFKTKSEVPDVIHGEEARARAYQQRREVPRPVNVYELPPGPSHADPFWLMERIDERRDPDILRRRKPGRQPLQAAEIVHGDDFREQWYPSILPGGSQQEDEGPELPRYMGGGMNDDDDEDDDELDLGPSVMRRACRCPPRAPESMPDSAFLRFGPASLNIPPDVEDEIRQPPAARISCPPEADVADFDQPNTFMRKLYEKYPYLYQILKETPPEDLASRVFKDRFLSTYQVDFLHMGVGREELPEGGARQEETFAGPDGEPEPAAIPGCSYRHSQRGDFGRKKTDTKKKEKEEEEVEQAEREEPRVSEYMGTVSRLGGEIVNDQLYRVADITKNMKNEYKKM